MFPVNNVTVLYMRLEVLQKVLKKTDNDCTWKPGKAFVQLMLRQALLILQHSYYTNITKV